MYIESEYLITSNREKVIEIFKLGNFDEKNIIDAFIALHMVLEIGLNSFFRKISFQSIKKGIDKAEIAKNIDSISYLDKIILFVYNSKFNFEDLSLAEKYHSIIGTARNFNGIRNQILHGHFIGTLSDEYGDRNTTLRKKLNEETLRVQVNDFVFILEGMQFYFNSLESSFSEGGKKSYIDSYLDFSFIKSLGL